jgi:hypothetical protein
MRTIHRLTLLAAVVLASGLTPAAAAHATRRATSVPTERYEAIGVATSMSPRLCGQECHTPPGPVSALTVAAGDGQVTASWHRPSLATMVNGYHLTLYVGATVVRRMRIGITGITTTATLTRLTNGTTYTLGVRAVNLAGAGPRVLSDPFTPAGVERA